MTSNRNNNPLQNMQKFNKGNDESLCDSKLFNKMIWKVDDLKLFLGLSKGTIYNKVSRRELPYRKKGRLLFFLPHEIMQWIKEGD